MQESGESTFVATTLAAHVAARAMPRELEVEPWRDDSTSRAVYAICAAIVGISGIVIAVLLL